MTKKMLNQNAKYDQRFLDKVEPKFEFSNKPINRPVSYTRLRAHET